MALLVAGEFPQADMDKVIRMCLIHDFGEAVTGDIPAFQKTRQDEENEDLAIENMLKLLPEDLASQFNDLFLEMSQLSTLEAKLFKGLDNLEALVSHNESSLDTWLPLEYTENLIYGTENVAFSEYLKELREEIKKDSIQKIEG